MMTTQSGRDALRAEVRASLKAAQEILEKTASNSKHEIPQAEYQAWYSKAMLVMKRAFPDRADEFESSYRPPANRKSLELSNFTISDAFLGVRPMHWPSGSAESVAMSRFGTQILILNAADDVIDSALGDFVGVLQADIFDSELSTADDLQKKGHLRAAGAVAGVVLESHLGQVLSKHKVKIAKKNPTVADLNDPLKDHGAYDLPQWRRIQHLADIRNLCVHKKDREPTSDEVVDLVAGVKAVVKTVA